MKATEKEELLNNLLRDDSYNGFRDDLFDQMRAKLRRQRMIRKARRLLACAACVIFTLSLFHFERTRPTQSPQTPRIDLVRTIPLRSDQIVVTAGHKSESISSVELVFVSTGRSNLEVIHTVSGSIERITDEQLLDLFKGQSVVLVHTGPNERQLVFPKDDEGR